MLKDSATKEVIPSEYERLKFAWKKQTNSTEKHRQEESHNHDNVQFALMRLFHGYLNQIWIDSQNMLQYAQSWSTNENHKGAAYTMHILGLHLMKQSLRTRQELFHLVNEASSSVFDSFPMPEETITTVTTPTPTPTSAAQSPYDSSSFTSSLSSSYSIASNYKPIKLSSSPSTPTISNNSNTTGSNDWQEDRTTVCKHAFTPGSNYSFYYPSDSSEKSSCHFCHEKLGLKKSFSVDNVCTLTSHSLNSNNNSDDETEDEDNVVSTSQPCVTSNKNSAFEIEIKQDDLLASRKLLVQDEDDGNSHEDYYREKLMKYQLISTLHESSKIEVSDDENTSFSSIGTIATTTTTAATTTTTTMEEPITATLIVNSNRTQHERTDSSSTYLPESVYSCDNDCNCETIGTTTTTTTTTTTAPTEKKSLSLFFNTVASTSNSRNKSSNPKITSKTNFKNKLQKCHKDSIDKNPIPRSLSNTICQLFSTPSLANRSSRQMRHSQI